MNKYHFEKYKKDYPRYFKAEKFRICKILPKAKVEHIGSTAIENLSGKGILDVLVSAPKKEVNQFLRTLKSAGYNFKEKAGTNERKFFEKDYCCGEKCRRVHIHLTHENSETWKESIEFRNKLEKNKKLREEYERVKKKALRLAKGDGKKYKEFKADFIKKVLK